MAGGTRQYGLEWKETLLSQKPTWTVEPDISAVQNLSRQHLHLTEAARCDVEFYAQGGFNKLFEVDTDIGSYLMRVALPVDPCYKTASEVATIDFVRARTNIPVPTIIAYDVSNENTLHFEWILMTLVPGRPLREAWRKMSMTKKEALVKQIAGYQAQLFDHKLDSIGNLYNSDGVNSFVLERMVAMPFFWGSRLRFKVPRGPFRNSHEWLSAHISLLLDEQESILRLTSDEDEIEDAETSRSLALQLEAILPEIFPSDAVESSIVFHDDISMQNILVDDTDKIVAVVDWECVSALPSWRACQLPHLLEGRTRVEKPRKETYGPDEDDEPGFTRTSKLDNEGVDVMYWEHLLEYEVGQLRQVFLLEMERLRPEWIREYRQAQLKYSFETAVRHADFEFSLRKVQKWLEAYKMGEAYDLRAKLIEQVY